MSDLSSVLVSPNYLLEDVTKMTLAWESDHYRDSPGFPDSRQLHVRSHLIQEELSELTNAVWEKDLQETLDALGDLDVVVTGTWIALGSQDHRFPERTIGNRFDTNLPKTGLVFYIIGKMQLNLSKLSYSFAEQDLLAANLALDDLDLNLASLWDCTGLMSLREETSKEILRSNLSKLDPKTQKVIKTPAGRVLKGPAYSPPDLTSILQKNMVNLSTGTGPSSCEWVAF